jgi:hypothetical protein
MHEVSIDGEPTEAASLAACVATILGMRFADIPIAPPDEPVAGWRVTRWLSGLGLGLVPVADAARFAWAGPWIGWMRSPAGDGRRAVVMYGSPAGVVWDPSGATGHVDGKPDGGFVIAALDVALARPRIADAPTATGTIDSIWIAERAAAPARSLTEAPVIAGLGVDGDRHVKGTGTFPSRMPGSALTLIEAEVVESFDPPLTPDEHRRNLVTRGIELTGLVGREFLVGTIRCRGNRLCEPCSVIQRYANRPILRPLVHRGGLRADILEDGAIRVGDTVRAL